MSEISRLIAREHIRDVLHNYCRGVDRKDWDVIRSCYHPGAIDDHSLIIGTVEELIQWLADRHATMPTSFHTVLNVSFLKESDRQVLTETYCIALQVLKEGSLTRNVIGCRYLDTFEDRGEGWRIAGRKVVYEWVDAMEAKRSFLDDRLDRATRDRTDPVYRLLAEANA